MESVRMLQPKLHQRRSKRGPLLAAAAIAATLFLLLKASGKRIETIVGQPLHTGSGENDGAAAGTRNRAWPQMQRIKDLETVWELPTGKPKGMLFVAHGCSHQGTDFWPASPRCLYCLGLPEELLIRHAALRRGYAVVAVTSIDRESKCWQNSSPAKSEDLQRLPDILRQVARQEGLQALPLYALGPSSGGSLVLRLAAVMPEVAGVVSQITPVNPTIFESTQGRGGAPFPPTLFVHMAQRDPEKAETVTAAMAILKEAGTPAAEIKIDPQPVTVQFLQRSPQIDAQLGEAIVAALQKGGALDKDGYLAVDPRSSSSNWRQLVKPVVGGMSLEPDESQLSELLNVAYARHEIVSDFIDASLAWLEAGGKKSVDSVLKQQRGRSQQR